MPSPTMSESVANTFTVPQLGSPNPTTITKANRSPKRVALRNVGPNLILIAYDALKIQSVGSSTEVYELPPGQTEVFVVAPGQGIFAAALGATGRLSAAVSEAVPLTWES